MLFPQASSVRPSTVLLMLNTTPIVCKSQAFLQLCVKQTKKIVIYRRNKQLLPAFKKYFIGGCP